MDELIENINEVVKQTIPQVPLGAEHSVFEPNEVGDYSIYISKNLNGILQIGISSNGKWYISKEILSSSEGSIVYFDKKIIPDIKVGHLYEGWIQKYLTYDEWIRSHYISVAESLFEKGIISLEQLLRIHNSVLKSVLKDGKLK